jgi:hypothetical protein
MRSKDAICNYIQTENLFKKRRKKEEEGKRYIKNHIFTERKRNWEN